MKKALVSFTLDRTRPRFKILLDVSGIYSLKAQNRCCRYEFTKFANKGRQIRRRHLPTRRVDPRPKFYAHVHLIKLSMSEELANVGVPPKLHSLQHPTSRHGVIIACP